MIVKKKNKNVTILIVDDDESVRFTLHNILSYEGYICFKAADGHEALDLLADHNINMMILDLKIPRMNGIEVLKKCLKTYPELPIIMISGQGTIKFAVEAIKLGAYDFLEKPLEAERILITINNVLERNRLKFQRDYLLTENKIRFQMIGTDPKMKEVFKLIEQAALTSSKVLIQGESGTGKELVAHDIHLYSERSGFPFVPVNCTAIPETLIESELFGHKKGSFTGAITDSMGKFQQANNGKIFLDEIGDMSIMMQSKLIRVIEDGYIDPVGATKQKYVDVRVIAATNKNIKQEIKAGNFREDLYYRLNVIPIFLPPLREKKMDIKPLAEKFIKDTCCNNGLPEKSFSKDVWSILMEYDWPGNVRELRNMVERATVITNECIINKKIIQNAMGNNEKELSFFAQENTLKESRASFEKDYILKTLAEHGGKIIDTAQSLGLERSHLWKKMKLYGIKKP